MKSRAHLSKEAMGEITGPPGWQKRAALTKRKRSLLLGPILDNDQVCTVYDLGMRTLNPDKLLPWIQTFNYGSLLQYNQCHVSGWMIQ